MARLMARLTNKGPHVRHRPRVVAGGYRQRLGLYRYEVHLTTAEHAALAQYAGCAGLGEQSMAEALARLIDEGLADGYPEGGPV